MTEFEQQVERCRERLLSTWPTAKPLAGIAMLYAAGMWFVVNGKGDLVAVGLVNTGVFLAAALAVGMEQRAKRRKALLGLATARHAVLGVHDINRGLVFVTPVGVFIEAAGYLVPFSVAAGAHRVTACRYRPKEHVLRVEMTGMREDEVADIHLPATVKPQQAEEACRLQQAAAAPAR